MEAALLIAALLVALVDEFMAHGKSILGWAVVLLVVWALVSSGLVSI